MADTDRLYFGNLTDKIVAAEQLYAECGAWLRQDPRVAQALEELDRRLNAVGTAMTEAGFDEMCSACGAKIPGGCCDAVIAEESDGMLLLINLLIGMRLQSHARYPGCCVFVGPRGCTLRAKPMICWNYNCRWIHQKLPRAGIDKVEDLVGLALQQFVDTEQAILSRLSAGPPDVPKRTLPKTAA